MNILLDYFFPITAISPTPEASTAFLKQVLAVVKPKGGAVEDTITLCTSKSAVDAFSITAVEVDALFDAGLSRVYVVAVDDLLSLGDILEGHESDFYTILISNDFTDEELGSLGSAAVKAQIQIQDILFKAKTAGVAGNSITITYVDDGAAGAETVGVSTNAITVHMEDGASTADNIRDAIENSVPATALVECLVDSGDETDPQDAVTSTSLAGGADAVISGSLDAGDFTGVIGVASDDVTFLTAQAATENRVGFYSTAGNRGKNLFYAMGKLLSNSLDWLNQQYITMPVADDVSTLGDANDLFDKKISFVISDTQYSERLALLATGGKAIVAPYIRRNLEIDMQSKALQYVSGNMPAYTNTQAALLEDELQKVVDSYIEKGWIEVGKVEVKLEEDNFVASGYINIREPKALWRVFGEIRQTL